MNTLCDYVFARKLTEISGQFFKDAPAKIIIFIICPFYKIGSNDKEKIERFKIDIQRACETGTVPIGFSAALACLFIAIIYYLNKLY